MQPKVRRRESAVFVCSTGHQPPVYFRAKAYLFGNEYGNGSKVGKQEYDFVKAAVIFNCLE
ncbi:hypothetical protein D3C85_1665760 [compost metagenome]